MKMHEHIHRSAARDERIDAIIRLNDRIRQLARRGVAIEEICAVVDRGPDYVRRIAGGMLL